MNEGALFATEAGQPVIDLRNVWASYERDSVLEDINFEVFPRDYIGLIGPNGGGKTTLIKVILGLLKPTSGQVRVLGLPPSQGRQYIGYVPQIQMEDRDFPISVQSVVAMGRLKPGFWGNLKLTPYDKQVIETSIRQTGVLDLANRSVNELSGGQRQRVFIARALATEPQILLLDEPTASVDSQTSQKLYELLAELNQRITIVLISHDLTAISTYVKTIGFINRRLMYQREKLISADMLAAGYECPVDMIAHGLPHRVLPPQNEEGGRD